jgi:hypothetical protein
MGIIKSDKTSSNSNLFFTTAFGAAGRALCATPFDNFAKRSQIYSGPLSWMKLPTLFFQNGPTKFDKLVNVYRGMTFGFVYKGMQAFAFDQSFEVQKFLSAHLGNGPLASVISSTAVATVQTLLLQVPSSIRVRMQVNKQAFEHPNTSAFSFNFKSSAFIAALRQKNFFDGTTANLARNMAFLTTSSLVVDSYRQIIHKYRILGSSEKLNEKQEAFARTLSGCTAVFVSVFFDNIKTRAQVNGKVQGQSNILSQVYKELKKPHGFRNSVRAAIPYSFAEGLGLVGFYTAMNIAKAMQISSSAHDESPSPRR